MDYKTNVLCEKCGNKDICIYKEQVTLGLNKLMHYSGESIFPPTINMWMDCEAFVDPEYFQREERREVNILKPIGDLT